MPMSVEINLNPYQGLKRQRTYLYVASSVEINLNPYQGLKPNSPLILNSTSPQLKST